MFLISVKNLPKYMFPPFSLAGAVISKLIKENIIENMIIPKRITLLVFNNASPSRASRLSAPIETENAFPFIPTV